MLSLHVLIHRLLPASLCFYTHLFSGTLFPFLFHLFRLPDKRWNQPAKQSANYFPTSVTGWSLLGVLCDWGVMSEPEGNPENAFQFFCFSRLFSFVFSVVTGENQVNNSKRQTRMGSGIQRCSRKASGSLRLRRAGARGSLLPSAQPWSVFAPRLERQGLIALLGAKNQGGGGKDGKGGGYGELGVDSSLSFWASICSGCVNDLRPFRAGQAGENPGSYFPWVQMSAFAIVRQVSFNCDRFKGGQKWNI